MKHLRYLAVIAACLFCASFALGQSVDAFLGFNALLTKSPNNGAPKLGSGLFPSAGGDIIFLPHGIGFGAQVAWRASQTDFFGEGVRPIMYSFNLAWEPIAPGFKFRPDFSIGAGAESLRFYQGVYTCGAFTGCSDYTSSNHGMLHAGVGLKVYFTDHLFLRPALDFYTVRHNFEFDVPNAWQTGIAIGYTLGPSS
ncbi:MAG: hypothetical protein ACRD01_13265 [Terriglobales bacterium]